MPLTNLIKPLVFVDADVLFAGSASANVNSASQVVLRMAEITLDVQTLRPGDFVLQVRDTLTRLIY